jgi:citrate synthase
MIFWRQELLTDVENQLLHKCLDAHAASVARENVSSVVFYAAAIGSRDYGKALAAALSTLGGKHAPIAATYEVLQDPVKAIALLESGEKVPGWGNSFAKGGIDPIWQPVGDFLKEFYSPIYQRIEEITVKIHCKGKQVYPNPACFTAATGIALKMPKEAATWIFVQGRLDRWSEIFCQSLAQ